MKLTRRSLFKVATAVGLGTMFPSKVIGGEIVVLSLTLSSDQAAVPPVSCQNSGPGLLSDAKCLSETEMGEDLLDSVDCRELAEQYSSFEKVGGYLGGFLAGQCLFCQADSFEGKFYVGPNEFRCDECKAIGTTLDFFARMEGISNEDAVSRLAVLVESGVLQRRRNEQQVLWGIMSEASRYYHYLLCATVEGAPGREWLEQQGVTAEVREKLCLGYFPHCRNGIRTELIEHLISLGYEADVVKSAILPSGYPKVLLPVRDAHGDCWGFLNGCLEAEEVVLHDSGLISMRRLAPRLYENLASQFQAWAGPWKIWGFEGLSHK